MRYFLEACCTSAADAVTAQRAGACRIELCSRLDIGGVTPSEDLIRSTLLALAEDTSFATSPSVPSSSPSSPLAGDAPSAAPIPVNVLVRPRGGDFVYSEEEIQQTIAGIEMCKQLSVRDSAGKVHRVKGIVIGALRADGGIDVAAMRRLVAAARPLQVTFHRAFDECVDVERGLEDVIALGCERLLTSGHEPDACAGRFTLARLVRQAAGRIVILAGRGVRPHNIAAIAGVTPSSALAGDNPSATVKKSNPSTLLEFHSSTLTGW